jgi:hypothetical protein
MIFSAKNVEKCQWYYFFILLSAKLKNQTKHQSEIPIKGKNIFVR